MSLDNKPPFNTPDDEEHQIEKDVREAYAEAFIEPLLIHYHQINQGNNGVIGLIDTDDLSEEVEQYFFKDKKFEDKKVAVKMLKIYSSANLAKQEGEVQKKAAELLKSQGLDVTVPEVYFCDRVPVSSDTLRDQLTAAGIAVKEDGVGLILMDYIKGEDMAEHLFKEVIKRSPEMERHLQATAGGFEHASFDDIQNTVRQGLGFEKPGGAQRTESLLSFEKSKVAKENQKKLFTFLSKNGYVLEPELLEKISQAVSALHEGGIYHRDLHERNIMIDFGKDGEIEKIHMIDFGSAINNEFNVNTESIYERDGVEYLNDEYLIRAYSGLTIPREEKEENSYLYGLNKNLISIKQNEERSKQYNSLQEKISKIIKMSEDEDLIDELNTLISDFVDDQIKDYVSEDNFNLKLSLWNELYESQPLLQERIRFHVKQLEEGGKNKPLYQTNAARNLSKYLDKKRT